MSTVKPRTCGTCGKYFKKLKYLRRHRVACGHQRDSTDPAVIGSIIATSNESGRRSTQGTSDRRAAQDHATRFVTTIDRLTTESAMEQVAQSSLGLSAVEAEGCRRTVGQPCCSSGQGEPEATSITGTRAVPPSSWNCRPSHQFVVIGRRGESTVGHHLPNTAAVDLKPTYELPMTTVQDTAAGDSADDDWSDDVEPESDAPCLTGRSAPIRVALADANRCRSATRINRCEPTQLPITISSDDEVLEITCRRSK